MKRELGIDPRMRVPGELISVLREQVMRRSVEEHRERVEAGTR